MARLPACLAARAPARLPAATLSPRWTVFLFFARIQPSSGRGTLPEKHRQQANALLLCQPAVMRRLVISKAEERPHWHENKVS
jgi:hypothetical protein